MIPETLHTSLSPSGKPFVFLDIVAHVSDERQIFIYDLTPFAIWTESGDCVRYMQRAKHVIRGKHVDFFIIDWQEKLNRKTAINLAKWWIEIGHKEDRYRLD